jgi:hypothetical protein
MPSLVRKSKKPVGSYQHTPPTIPLHIEKHIKHPPYSPTPSEPTLSRVIVIDLVGD